MKRLAKKFINRQRAEVECKKTDKDLFGDIFGVRPFFI